MGIISSKMPFGESHRGGLCFGERGSRPLVIKVGGYRSLPGDELTSEKDPLKPVRSSFALYNAERGEAILTKQH